MAETFPSGDPEASFEAFCQGCGFSEELGCLLVVSVGEQQARSLIKASCTPAPVFLHVSSLKDSPQETQNGLREAGIGFDAVGDVPLCIQLHQARDAAQRVAYECVRSHLPASLLEVGAGRGTKTIIIQSLAKALHGQQIPRFVCIDAVASKREVLLGRARLCGANVTECLTADGAHLEQVLSGEPFDVVFVDAPCSGLGTLRRHPEIVWRMREDDILSLAALQERILLSAGGFVAPQGQLVYSTCTVTRQENEDIIQALLDPSRESGFAFAGGFQTLCTEGGPDSHFCTRLLRLGDQPQA